MASTDFGALADELAEHLAEEELVVVPACLAVERGSGAAQAPAAVDEPIRAMLHDHDEVAAGLARLRTLTGGYRAPADACSSYRAMLDRLAALARDVHRHVHEENNILFPRPAALAGAAQPAHRGADASCAVKDN